MALTDLQFKVVSTNEVIYDPLVVKSDRAVSATSVVVRVTNLGEDALEGIGVYLVPTTNLGDVDNPAEFPPETDYHDVLEWGQATADGTAASGGVKLTLTNNDGAWTGYCTREQGSLYLNRIPLIDLAANESTDITVLFEEPPSAAARRLFVDLRVE